MYGICFSIPKEKVCTGYTDKTKILSNLIPGNIETYIYDTEEDYYNEYKKSYFAITKMKGGWDCMRHYEILANGCVPFFIDIDNCPKNTLSLMPKQLLIKGNHMYNTIFKHKTIDSLTDIEIQNYNELRSQLLEYTKTYLVTNKIAEYILNTLKLTDVKKILYLSGNTNPDYLRCTTLHGFKVLFGDCCHDYPIVPHIYKSDTINYKGLYGKGISYTNLLEPELHNNDLDISINKDIVDKYYDIIIYGSFHRGMPFYDLISRIYDPNKIILLCGEDFHMCNSIVYEKKGHPIFKREF